MFFLPNTDKFCTAFDAKDTLQPSTPPKDELLDYNNISVLEFTRLPEPLDERISEMNVKHEPPDVASLNTWSELPYNELMTKPNGDEEKQKHNLTNIKRIASYLSSVEKAANERKSRLYHNAVQTAIRRSMESDAHSFERRRKNALRAAKRRNNETADKRALRLERDRVRLE